jgi:hypothetical protein
VARSTLHAWRQLPRKSTLENFGLRQIFIDTLSVRGGDRIPAGHPSSEQLGFQRAVSKDRGREQAAPCAPLIALRRVGEANDDSINQEKKKTCHMKIEFTADTIESQFKMHAIADLAPYKLHSWPCCIIVALVLNVPSSDNWMCLLLFTTLS